MPRLSEAVFLQTILEGSQADAKLLRGVRPIAFVRAQRVLDCLALDVLEEHGLAGPLPASGRSSGSIASSHRMAVRSRDAIAAA